MPQRQRGTNLHEQQGAHSKHQVVGEHTKWEMNFKDILTNWNVTLIFLLDMWTFRCPWTRGHFRCYPSQELLCRGTSNSWRPRIRFKSVIGDRWSTAFSWAIAWFCLDVPLSPINRLQHPFQCQWFGQLRLVSRMQLSSPSRSKMAFSGMMSNEFPLWIVASYYSRAWTR